MIIHHNMNQRGFMFRVFIIFMCLALLSGLLAGYLSRQLVQESLKTRVWQVKLTDSAPLEHFDLWDPGQPVCIYDQETSSWLHLEGQPAGTAGANLASYLIQDPDQRVAVNEDRQGYWLSFWLGDSDRYQAIQYHPRESFQGIYQTVFRTWLLVLLLFIVCLGLQCWMGIRFISRPLQAMTQALSNYMTRHDRFEYVGSIFPPLDNLGQVITRLNKDYAAQQHTLKNSEQRLALILSHINLGVLLINSQQEIEICNPEARKILGITDKTKTNYRAVIRSTPLVDMISKVLQSQVAVGDEIEIYIPSPRQIDVTIIPYDNADDEGMDAVLVLLYDISQIRKLETIRTEFVANASHELRTPVTAIKGFSETLLAGAKNDPTIQDNFLQIIYKESNRLEAIINDILELSRIEKQKEPKQIDAFNAVAMAEDLLKILESKADKKGIDLVFRRPAEPVQLYSDRQRIEQVLTNLLDNGINYTQEGGWVELSLEELNDWVQFKVSDNGIGIPLTDQDRIFERFYRVEKGRSRHSGGTGLGLSIVRNLVELLQGQIQVQSKPGQGSVFTLKLPK